MTVDRASNPWSVPGSLAEPELREELPRHGRDDGGASPDAPADRPGPVTSAGPLDDTESAAVPSVSLQPMTVADILDGAFSIIKARPARILGLAAVFVVPVHLFAAYLQRNAENAGVVWDAFTSDDPAVLADASQSSSGAEQFWASILILVVPALALVFVAAAIAQLVAAWTVGRDMTAGELLRALRGRLWSLFASYLLVHVLEMFGIVGCYIGPLFVMAFFVVTAPVIGAEGLGPLAAMRRASNLASRRYWPVLGISILIGLVATLLDQALGGLPQLIAFFLDAELAWPVAAAGSIIGAVISTPFVAAATVLLYLDLRVRTEGLDIELAAIDLVKNAR